MSTMFASYAASEFERLTSASTGRITVELRVDRFRACEEHFDGIIAGDADLKNLHEAATKAAGSLGLPANANWPALTLLEPHVDVAKLPEIGARLAQTWATAYKIDMGSVVYRLELALVSALAPRMMRVVDRPHSDTIEGGAILRAMQEIYPQLLKRIETFDWWAQLDDATRCRVAAIAGRTILGEAEPSIVAAENEKRLYAWGGRNLAGMICLLAEAPLNLWRTAQQQVALALAAEQRWAEKIPGLASRDLKPLGLKFRRARAKGPVSVVLDSFGLSLPNQTWAKMAEGIIEKSSAERLSEWALAAFATKAIQVVARHAVLSHTVKNSPPPYSAHLAKCVVSAYAHDTAYLARTTTVGKVSAASTGVLFWSAIARGWDVGTKLVPGYFQGRQRADVALAAG